MVDFMFVLCVYHFWVDFEPIFEKFNFWALWGPFSSYMAKKLKVPSYQGRWPQIKKFKKQTSFKIQIYIGIEVTRFDFQQLLHFGPNSSTPTGQRSYDFLTL